MSFIKKQTGPNLIPELYDGYDYQYAITQEFRNKKGILDANPVFKGRVVKIVKDLINSTASVNDYKFIVIAKVEMLDDTFDDVSDYTQYQNSTDVVMMNAFIPESLDLKEPEVGEEVYLQFKDPYNRTGGVYKGKVKGFNISELVVDAAKNVIESAKNLFNNNTSTPSTIGECKYANKQSGQVDYSNCKTSYPQGEYEIFFGNKNSFGKAKMVLLDFNSKPNIAVEQLAYNSLKKMFQDAKTQGVTLQINSGYRSYETQECFYNNYLACYQEWIKSGKSGVSPSVAADPKKSKPTTSSHLNGKAVDFNTGGVSRTDSNLQDVFTVASADKAAALEMAKKKLQQGSINSKAWQWLVFNSEKYGWVWSGIAFREPWHFHFDENLARKNGII